jgi:hypothetical protein
MRRWLLLLTSLAGLAQAAPPAPRVEVAYELSQEGSVLADVVEVLEYGGGRYQITETSTGRGVYALLGSIKRTSRGLIDAIGVRPLEFIDERPVWPESSARFDWQARTIIRQHKGVRETLPMPADAQDGLSFMLAFSLFPPKEKSVTYNIADGRGISSHLYSIGGEEKLKTPAGEFSTLKLVRTKEKERIEIWLAMELGYFPVRAMSVSKNGRRLDQVAVRVSAAPP